MSAKFNRISDEQWNVINLNFKKINPKLKLLFSFVRGYLELKTHATISRQELKKNKTTGMPKTTEVVIRLLMAEFIGEDFSERF